MRALIPAVLTASLFVATPVRAQDPGQIFGFILGEVERQANRQQQRNWQRDQQRQQAEQWQSFLALWRACFDQNDISSCDQAIAYPNIGADNTQRLQLHMDTLLAVEQSARAEVRRQIAEADARVRDLEAAQARLAEAQREIEAQRLADTRALARALDDCRRFDLVACDRAAASPLATTEDQTRIASWRQLAEQFAADLAACRTGSVAACDQAALSPAITEDNRRRISEWRLAASPWNRMKATLAAYTASARDSLTSLQAEIAALPRSTLLASGLAGSLAAALGFILWRQHRSARPAAPAEPVATQTRSSRHRLHSLITWVRRQRLLARLRRLAFRLHVRLLARLRSWRAPTSAPVTSTAVAIIVSPVGPRDPETAVAALRLAHAYMSEFDGKLLDIMDDASACKNVLNTLSLVSQQLAVAERADPSAMLEIEPDTGGPLTLTIAELKAMALYAEAICRANEKPRRALTILEQAAAFDPSFPIIPYFAGLLHMDLMQKRAAIASFERALALDPENLQYRKMLVRAQSLSGAEIAHHRVLTGARRVVFSARVITLLLHLAPMTLIVLSIITHGLATTPQARDRSVILFLVGIGLALALQLLHRTKRWLTAWFHQHAM